jgi:hypothetical protein
MNPQRLLLPCLIATLLELGVPSASAGNCIWKLDGFELNADTVYWNFVIGSSSECLQGLRGNTMLIDQVKIIEPPKAGSLRISGPAFHYTAPSTAGSLDSFRLEILGQNHRVRGMSVIVVGVEIR